MALVRYSSMLALVRYKTLALVRVTIKNPLHKQFEKACMCFKTRRVRTRNFTVLISHQVYEYKNATLEKISSHCVVIGSFSVQPSDSDPFGSKGEERLKHLCEPCFPWFSSLRWKTKQKMFRFVLCT